MRIYPEKCLSCDRSFNCNEQIIVKLPEWACFWSCCWDKYPDHKKYEWEECWMTLEFYPWTFISNE